MNILEEIVANKRNEVTAFKTARPMSELESAARRRGRAQDFVAALHSVPIGLIAEVKRRSPSAGTIRGRSMRSRSRRPTRTPARRPFRS